MPSKSPMAATSVGIHGKPGVEVYFNFAAWADLLGDLLDHLIEQVVGEPRRRQRLDAFFGFVRTLPLSEQFDREVVSSLSRAVDGLVVRDTQEDEIRKPRRSLSVIVSS